MAKTKQKKETISKEESERLALERKLAEIRKKYETGRLPKNPTRKFDVGQQVQVGAWGTTHVTEVLDDGLIYKVHGDYMGQHYGNPVRIIQDAYIEWVDLLPYVSPEQDSARPQFYENNHIHITYYQSAIDSLLHKAYSAGVDFNPDYQRDLVWTLEQKQELIHSIFNHVDIGKFTFMQPYLTEHAYKLNRRYDRDTLFEDLMKLCATEKLI